MRERAEWYAGLMLLWMATGRDVDEVYAFARRAFREAINVEQYEAYRELAA